MNITTEQLENLEAEVKFEFSRQFSSMKTNPELSIDHYVALMDVTQLDPIKALRNYFFALEILRADCQLCILRGKELSRIVQLAERSLIYCQIKPTTSRLSYLYAMLYNELAQLNLVQRNSWSSVAANDIANFLGRDSLKKDLGDQAMLQGLQAWQLGNIKMSILAFHHAEQCPYRPEELRMIRLWLIRCYRIQGELAQVDELIMGSRTEFQLDECWTQRFAFEEAIHKAHQDQDFQHLIEHLRSDHQYLSHYDLVRANLWLYASKRRDLKKFSTTRRINHGDYQSYPYEPVAAQCLAYLRTIQQCHDTEIALDRRLATLGKRLDDCKRLCDPELRLLFTAAALRWLYRNKLQAFARLLLDEYEALGRKFSGGRSPDPFNLMEAVAEKLPEMPRQIHDRLPRSNLVGMVGRFFKLTRVVTSSVYHLAKYRLRRKRAKPDFLQLQQDVFQQIILSMEEALGTLRGPSLKLAQYLGVSRLLSKQSQQTIERIYNQPPSFSSQDMLSYAEKSLGSPLHHYIRQVNPDPIGVASIGQVYSGLSQHGEPIAIKIKYPDIEPIVRMDLMMMRLLSPILRYYLPNTDISRLWQLFEVRFLNECNFEEERRRHQQFYEIFADDPYIKIAQIYPEVCSKVIFTTEMIEGQRLDRFLRTADAGQKERVAHHLLYFHLRANLQYGLWHIDPHPANFIVQNDRLAVLDFGAIYKAGEPFNRLHRLFAQCRVQPDYQRLYRSLVDYHIVDPVQLSEHRFIEEVAYYFLFPFHCDEVRPFYLDGEINLGFAVSKLGLNHAFRIDAEDFFSFAVSEYFGDLLASLELKINWHRLYRQCLDEIGVQFDRSK